MAKKTHKSLSLATTPRGVAALVLGDEVQVGACVRGWGGLTRKRACAQLSQTQAKMIPQGDVPGGARGHQKARLWFS